MPPPAESRRVDRAELLSLVGLAVLAVMAAAVGYRPVEDGDLFWNLSIGRWVLAHHSLLPAVDPFTYNASAAPVQHEWLSQVALAAVADFGGLMTLRMVGGAWCAGLIGVAFLALRRRGASAAVALAGTALWWLFAAPHAVVRPHLIAWLPAWIFMGWLVDAPRPRRVAAGFVIVALWGNLHGSVLLAPAWCAAMLLTALMNSARQHGLAGRPALRAARPWVIHLAWTSVAALLQPAGWTLLPYALHTPAVNKALSNEWWPLLRADVWASRPSLLVAWAGLAASVAVVVVVGAVRQATQSSRPIQAMRAPGPLLAMAAVIHAGWTRRMTVYLLVPILWLADRIASRRTPWRHTQRIALAVAVVAMVAASPEVRGWRGAQPLRPGAFPVGATTFVGQTQLRGRPMHPDGWGGFVSWRLRGRVKTYADGRWPLVGQQVIADGVAMLTRRGDAQRRFAQYRVDWLMSPTRLYLRVPPPAPRRWLLAWQDGTAVVLLRRGAAFDDNVRRVCAFYRAYPTLRSHARWRARARGPAGVPVPTDVPSILSQCREATP